MSQRPPIEEYARRVAIGKFMPFNRVDLANLVAYVRYLEARIDRTDGDLTAMTETLKRMMVHLRKADEV